MEAIFTDAQGRVWHPRFTFSAIDTIRTVVGIDLLKPVDPAVIADLEKLLPMLHETVKHEEAEFEDFQTAIDAGPFAPMMQAFNDALGIFMQGPDYERPIPDEEPDGEDSDPT